MPDASVRRAQAFAPSHVSGIFVPRLEGRDPRARGSVGAGVVLDVGVTAVVEWQEGGRTAVRFSSNLPSPLEISATAARRLLGARRGRLTVHLDHPLPLGQGFGSSAAGTLATSLAVADLLGLPRRKAVEVAHLAELFGGGGLGGVAAILGGGLEVRTRPGVPPFGRVVHRAGSGVVILGTVADPIRSPDLLHDSAGLRRFRVGERWFDELASHPGWPAFWEATERFTDAVGLAPPRLRAVIRGARRRGARAGQAMFGGSFLALPPGGNAGRDLRRWLGGRGIPYREVAIGRHGACRRSPAGDQPPAP